MSGNPALGKGLGLSLRAATGSSGLPEAASAEPSGVQPSLTQLAVTQHELASSSPLAENDTGITAATDRFTASTQALFPLALSDGRLGVTCPLKKRTPAKPSPTVAQLPDWLASDPSLAPRRVMNASGQIQQKAPRLYDKNFRWDKFPKNFDGYKKIGVHETKGESVASLVEKGPLRRKIDSNNGIGKGPGFYVTPIGNKQLHTALGDITYGERFLAVYVPTNFKLIRAESEDENNVRSLDDKCGKVPRVYYAVLGGGEIIIPKRCFAMVRLAAVPGDLENFRDEDEDDANDDASDDDDHDELLADEAEDAAAQADAAIAQLADERERELALRRSINEEERRHATAMNELSMNYNSTSSAARKARLRKRWQAMDNRLFDLWCSDTRRRSLYWQTLGIGEPVPVPALLA